MMFWPQKKAIAKKILKGLITLLIIALPILFFKSSYWYPMLEKIIIKSVAKSDLKLEMNITDLNIWSGLDINHIQLHTFDSSLLVSADSLIFRWNNPFNLLRKTFESIDILKPELQFNSITKSEEAQEYYSKSSMSYLNIYELNIKDGNIEINLSDERHYRSGINLTAAGKINADTLMAEIKELEFKNSLHSFTIKGNFKKVNNIVRLWDFLLFDSISSIEISSKIKIEKPWHYEAELIFDDIYPNNYYKITHNNSDNISGKLRTRGSIDRHRVDANLKLKLNDKNYELNPLDFVFENNTLFFNKSQFRSDKIEAEFSGLVCRDSSFEIQSNISLFPGEFLPEILEDLESRAELQAGGIWPDSIHIKVDGNLNSKNFAGETIVFSNILVENGVLKLIEPLKVASEAARLEITGMIDTQTIDLQLAFSVKEPENWLKNIHINGNPELGSFELKTSVQGNTFDPNLDGELTLHDFKYASGIVASEKLRGFFRFKHIMSDRLGDIYLNLTNNSLYHLRNMDGWILLENKMDTLTLHTLQLSNGEDRIESSAKMISDQLIEINGFAARIKNNTLQLKEPVSYSLDLPFSDHDKANFDFNKGSINFEILRGDSGDFEMLSTIQNVKLEDILTFTYPDSLPFTGLVNSHLSYSKKANKKLFQLDLQGDNLSAADYNFKQLNTSFEVDSALRINTFFLSDYNDGELNITSHIPLINNELTLVPGISYDKEASITIAVNQLDLSHYSEFIKPIPLSAIFSGILTLENTLAQPDMNATVNLNKIKIGRVELQKAFAKINYTEGPLELESFTVFSDSGEYHGHGHLPFEFSIPKAHAALNRDSSMYIFLSGHDRNLPFLSPYVYMIENLDGDILSEIRFSGTPAAPVRDGNLTIQNGILYVDNMANSVTDIHGSGRLESNMLKLNIDGKVQKKAKTILEEISLTTGLIQDTNEDNVQLSGTIDLHKLFYPDLDLKLRGEQLYYADLLDNLSVVTDAELSLTGIRKIKIVGDLGLHEGEFNYEFASSNPVLKGKKQSSFAYEITLPILKDTYIRNSLVDAELQGEIILTKQEYEPDRMGGELQLINGKFYYYSSIFDIDYGKITFDPSQNNHSIDFTASTPIGDGSNRIIANYSGDLKKPFIELSDEENIYLSQSELIQILTTGIVPKSKDMSTDVFSGTAQNIVGAVLEKEMERTASDLGGFSRVDFKSNSSALATADLDSMSILLGRRLGKNVYMTYERNLSATNPNQEIEVEYRFNKNVSVIGSADEESVSAAFRLRFRY